MQICPRKLCQTFIIVSLILLIRSINFEGLGFVIIMLVSSANKIIFDGPAIIFGRSFTWIKKKTKDQVLNLQEPEGLF